jgi:pyridoxine 5-phosphate synthase
MHSLKAPRLGINIDHFATLRQLRGTPYPDLLQAVDLALKAGAEQVTLHLREDRRHIQDEDVILVRSHLKKRKIPLNLEMALTSEMLKFASKHRPDWVCLVPEKRMEQTTEGGLDVKKSFKKIRQAQSTFARASIKLSLFIEPEVEAIWLARELGADAIELHTGSYCRAYQDWKGATRTKSLGTKNPTLLTGSVDREFSRLERAAREGHRAGLRVHAGHGLDLVNIRPLTELWIEGTRAPLIEEYNIGHFLVCRAALVGLECAVREMVSAIQAP